jgi:AcrR family transcriptional regulator
VPVHERPIRRDAARNRARLTHVAADALRDQGLDVGVDEIARRAGVGVATLYRHFPAKADLVLAVLEQVVDELGAAVPDLVLRSSRPLHDFLERAVALQSANRGLLDALAAQSPDGEIRRRLGDRLVDALGPLVQAAHRSGELRVELAAEDLLVLLRMLGAATPDPQRYLAIALRGVAPDRR